MSLFDECFNTYNFLTEKPKKWNAFWNKELEKLKSIPFEIKKIQKDTTSTIYTIEYHSAEKQKIKGTLVLPEKVKKPPVIVFFPDYFSETKIYKSLNNAGFAQFSVRLRGHENFKRLNKEAVEIKSDEIKEKSYGYFSENLLVLDNYYMKNLYLDAYRTLEILRLQKEINSSRIGIWGTGIGAAMGLFAASFMKRTSALFLESPSFALLSLTQNISKTNYAREINSFIRAKKANKHIIKENLNLLDSMYFADNLEIPVHLSVNLKDKENVPQGGFAVFHRIPSEKDILIFTDLTENTTDDMQKTIIQTAKNFFEKKIN
ncbi:MAG: acetylxylan esterase [Spirochaetia bacterium]|nr:acetylxylan esterase [Spirochaetia bacterium]